MEGIEKLADVLALLGLVAGGVGAVMKNVAIVGVGVCFLAVALLLT